MNYFKESIEDLVNSGESKEVIIKALLELDKHYKDLHDDFVSATGVSSTIYVQFAEEKSTMIYEAISKIDKKLGKSLIAKIDY